MKSLIRLNDYTKEDIKEIFKIADRLQMGEYKDFFKEKSFLIFFQNSSLRTRVTFEKGINSLSGQAILFPPETLDKKEEIRDVVGYLNNWIDGAIIRHKDISLLDEFSKYAKFSVINGMTDINHPCEMLADMYSLSKIRKDFTQDNFLFVGPKGNIGLAWKEASNLMGFKLEQCCPKGYEIEGLKVHYDLRKAMEGADIICTDSIPEKIISDFKEYRITKEMMNLSNENSILNPCPPFYRGKEVSEDVINSSYFVGYEFKKYLLEIQQAILIFNLIN